VEKNVVNTVRNNLEYAGRELNAVLDGGVEGVDDGWGAVSLPVQLVHLLSAQYTIIIIRIKTDHFRIFCYRGLRKGGDDGTKFNVCYKTVFMFLCLFQQSMPTVSCVLLQILFFYIDLAKQLQSSIEIVEGQNHIKHIQLKFSIA